MRALNIELVLLHWHRHYCQVLSGRHQFELRKSFAIALYIFHFFFKFLFIPFFVCWFTFNTSLSSSQSSPNLKNVNCKERAAMKWLNDDWEVLHSAEHLALCKEKGVFLITQYGVYDGKKNTMMQFCILKRLLVTVNSDSHTFVCSQTFANNSNFKIHTNGFVTLFVWKL